jgi:hypothetical protein
MGKDDARKFDHNTLEALRMRAVQVGEKALRLSRASLLGVAGWRSIGAAVSGVIRIRGRCKSFYGRTPPLTLYFLVV